ncbi:MAG: hypothetical protein GXX93_09180 [Anaerolineae bacterium]|nr:hypothetical protein [Anaerolineae bacterium]
MFARVSQITGLPGKLETAVPVLQEGLDLTQGLAGFEGAYLLVDRDKGKIMAVTFWNNQTDLKLSAPRAESTVADAAKRAGAEIDPQVESYEVLLEI